MNIKEQIETLREELRQHNYNYYVLDNAIISDFDFDIKLKTVSFKFKVPGQATISVNGSELDAKAKGALRRAKAGQSVQIFDIKVKNPNNPSYRFKKVSPVICEIVN